MNDTPSDTFNKRVKQYISVRDMIAEMKEKHKLELEELIETQNLLSAWFIEHLEAVGATSVKTDSGTVYSSTTYRANLSDPKAFMDYVIANNQYDLLDRKANVTAVKAHVEATGSLPPGANLNAIRTIGVRK